MVLGGPELDAQLRSFAVRFSCIPAPRVHDTKSVRHNQIKELLRIVAARMAIASTASSTSSSPS
jgi:hypothetical protein